MPDIDIDFCYERRDEVLRYVKERYGSDHVSQIITFGTMAARAVIRDVGRALGLPYADVDEVAKLVPRETGVTPVSYTHLQRRIALFEYVAEVGIKGCGHICRQALRIESHNCGRCILRRRYRIYKIEHELALHTQMCIRDRYMTPAFD